MFSTVSRMTFEILEPRVLLAATTPASSVVQPHMGAEEVVAAEDYEPPLATEGDDDVDCGEAIDCRDPAGTGYWERDRAWDYNHDLNEPMQPPDERIHLATVPGLLTTSYWYLTHEWVRSSYIGNTAGEDYNEKTCLTWQFSMTQSRSLGSEWEGEMGPEGFAKIGVTVTEQKTSSGTAGCPARTFTAGPTCNVRWRLELFVSKYQVIEVTYSHSYADPITNVRDTGIDPCRADVRTAVQRRWWVPQDPVINPGQPGPQQPVDGGDPADAPTGAGGPPPAVTSLFSSVEVEPDADEDRLLELAA